MGIQKQSQYGRYVIAFIANFPSKKTRKHAVVIMDGASWHQEYLDDDFENLNIIRLPPYSPELNPIEQVWSWLRQNEIANRCFTDYEDIVGNCSRA